MSETASDDGIDFVAQGNGPAVLFVSGSFGTPAAWRGMWKRLPAGYRLAATSILGYGATRETRTPADLAMAHEVRVVGKAAARIGAPVHLVGHSFGGTVALAAALAGTVEVRSIATFEANPLALIREHGSEGLYERTRAMSHAFEAAQAGAPWQNGKAILSRAGSKSLRMADVFKSQKAWRNLIRSDRRGGYRLNLD